MQTIPERKREREKKEEICARAPAARARIRTYNSGRSIGRFTRNYAICTRDVWKCTFSCAGTKLQTRVHHSSSSFDDSAVAIGRRYFAPRVCVYARIRARAYTELRPKCKYKMQSRGCAYAKQRNVTPRLRPSALGGELSLARLLTHDVRDRDAGFSMFSLSFSLRKIIRSLAHAMTIVDNRQDP